MVVGDVALVVGTSNMVCDDSVVGKYGCGPPLVAAVSDSDAAELVYAGLVAVLWAALVSVGVDDV